MRPILRSAIGNRQSAIAKRPTRFSRRLALGGLLLALSPLLFALCALPFMASTRAAADSSPDSHQSSSDWISDRAWMHGSSPLSSLLATRTLSPLAPMFTAGTENDFFQNAAMTSSGNYSLGHLPLNTEDVLLTTSTPALTITAANRAMGTLNQTNNTAYTISNNTTVATNSNLNLGGGGTTDSIVGSNGADLIFLGGANSSLTIQGPNGSSGSGVLNVAALADGNFDVANSGATLNISSIVSGAFNLTKIGAGTLNLSGVNTFGSGKTFTLSAGSIVLGNKAALGTGTIAFNGVNTSASTDLQGANAITNNGTFGASGNSFSGSNGITFTGTFTNSVTSNTITNGITFLTFNGPFNLSDSSTNRTVTIDGGGATVIGGVIANGGGSTSNLAKSGSGNLGLSGVNTYTGTTVINAGTLALSANGSIANSSSITIGGGSRLDLSGLNTALTLPSGQIISAPGNSGPGSGLIAVTASKGLTTAGNTPLQFTAFDGSTPPLKVSGAGVITLAAGDQVTVTTTSALGVGDYVLISKGVDGGSVAGAVPTLVAVNGSGLAAATVASLQITSQQLVLHVAALPLKYRSKQSGNWNSASTWETSTDGTTWSAAASTPTSADDTIEIQGGQTVTVTATVTVDQVTVDSGGTLALGAALTNSGTLTVNGTLQFNSGGSISGSPTYGSNAIVKYNTGTTTGPGDEWLPNITTGAGCPQNVTLSGNTTFNLGNSSTTQPFTMRGTLTINSGSVFTMNGSGSQMTQALTLNGGSVDNFGTLVLSALSGGDMNVAGAWDNFGTFTPNGRTVTLNGTTNFQSLTGNTTFSNLTINHGVALGNVNAAGSTLAVTGLMRVQKGTFISATQYGDVQIDASGTLTLSGDISVSGNWTNNGTFNNGGFKVTFNGSANQSISGSTSTAFATLAVSNTGSSGSNTVSLSQDISDTALNVTSGVFDQGSASSVTSGAATVSTGTTWSNFGSGDLTLSGNVSNSGTINFNGGGTSCGDADTILIRSSDNSTQRTWSGSGTFSMTDVNVSFQKVPGGVTAPLAILVNSGTNAGSNTGWVFVDQCTAGTYTWIGGTAGANTDWTVPTNWSPTRATVAAGDVLIFDGTATPSPTVTNVANLSGETISKLRVINGATPSFSAGAAVTLTINAGSGNTGLDLGSLAITGSNALTISVASGTLGAVTGNMSVAGGAHRLIGNAASAITFQSGSIFTTTTGFTGNAFGTATAGSVIFASGSAYFHNAGASPFGTGASVVTFQTGSEAHFLTSTGFEASGRTYADLIIGSSSTPVNISESGSGSFQVDNLVITSTNSASSSLNYTGSGASAITLQGNITSAGTFGGTSPDLILTAGTGGIQINVPGGGTVTYGNGPGSPAHSIDFETDATVDSATTLNLARIVQMGLSANKTMTVNGTVVPNALSAQGYVIGGVLRTSLGIAYTFPVGTVNGYTPVDLANTTGSGSLKVATHSSSQPALDATKSLHEYWTLTNSGSVTTDITFQYLQGDVPGTSNETNYRVIKVEGSNATSFPNTVNSSANTGTVTQISSFSDWTVGEPVSPTEVRLMSFAATRNGDDVMLQWESGYEVRNLGYRIYREQNGKRTLITPSLVAGSALTVGLQTEMASGFSYTWYDRRWQGSGVTYWLEDIDLDGTSTLHGPVAPVEDKSQSVNDKERSPLLDELTAKETGVEITAGVKKSEESTQNSARDNRKTASSVQKSGAANASLSVQETIAATPGVKIQVSKAGWYRVTQPELIAAGLDPNAGANQLQLFANAQQVPMRISNNTESLGASDFIEFYGNGLKTPTDDEQTYYLVVGSTAGLRMGVASNGAQAAPPAAANFDYTVERKDRQLYYSSLLNGDAENIFGKVVNNNPISLAVPVTHLDSAAGGQAHLEVSLAGVSFEEHHVVVNLNGSDLGTIVFGLASQPRQVFEVPASLLREGDNAVQLRSVGSKTDVSLSDTIRLTYPHRYIADNDGLPITVNSGTTQHVEGFSTQEIRAVDITDAGLPVELTPTITAQSDGTFAADIQVANASTSQPRTVLLFTQSGIKQVDALRFNQPSAYREVADGAEYLILTAHEFIPNARELAQYRQKQGFVTSVIDVEDLYDEFSFGVHTPSAVRDFLQNAMTKWALKPRYVVLLGDASYDPKNYLGRGANDFVPTKLFDTTVMETASDDWLTDFDGDGVADLATGRLPAKTAGDANVMVKKIISYENSLTDLSRGAVLVADRTFENTSGSLQNVMPSDLPKQLVNRSSDTDAAIHYQIVTAINRGPLFVNYVGHGSTGVWTGARLLSNADAPLLTNSDRLSFFAMMTCMNGYFHDAANDSLAEALLRSSGGAVATWASSGLTEPSAQALVDAELYRQIFSDQRVRLGDAIRMAKLATSDNDIRRTWTLLGDPALNLVTTAPSEPTQTLSGTVLDRNGQPLAGVAIRLTGGAARESITDANGKYSFAGIQNGADYTLTASLVNYSFSPASRSYTQLANRVDGNFIGTANGAALNPLDTDTFFVRQHYLDFLNREPDESGFNFWTNQIGSCGVDDRCREVKRVNTSAAYFLSIEFQETGFEVYRMYKAAYGNLPNSPVPLRLVEFTADAHDVSSGVIVGRANWQATLEANKAAFAQQFVQRARFAAQYSNSMSPAEFVDALFAQAGVAPAADERTEAINEFAGAANSLDVPARARALRRVAENPRLTRQEFNRAFVLMQYFGYLRRDPNSGPDADFSGYNFWLGKLNSFNGNFIDAEMVKAFLSSDEYRGRFTR